MTHDHRQVIAIDGPGAAGKSTVARLIAEQTRALLFDTGALYRAVTLLGLREGVPGSDGVALAGLARLHRIDVLPPSVDDGRQVDVKLDGEDVTWSLRTPEIDARVSEVSAHAEVRQELLGVQRAIADGNRIVMVGRDIATVVIPHAGVKIYLDASVQERARRRFEELQARGVDARFDDVLADLQARDDWDSNRKSAPLSIAADATVVHTDGRTVDDIVAEIVALTASAWDALDV